MARSRLGSVFHVVGEDRLNHEANFADMCIISNYHQTGSTSAVFFYIVSANESTTAELSHHRGKRSTERHGSDSLRVQTNQSFASCCDCTTR